jgi:CheY-like chemotaxis protein
MIDQTGGLVAKPLVALAEDDQVQAELVTGWLRALGFQVMAFPHGDALAEWASLAESEAPSAIVLDVEMPGSDGFTTCRYLRTIPEFAGVPVACVSSLDADVLARGALAAGADASLRKDSELLPRLAQWLERA